MKNVGVRTLAALFVALLLTIAGVTSASATMQDDVFVQTNAQRAAAGVATLTRDATLDAAAQEWAQTMSNTGNFVHSTSAWRAARIPSGWTTHGENIAYGYTSASAVMNGWMNSQGHRDNILRSSYTHMGVGYVASGNYWVQIFAGYPAQPPFGWLDGASVGVASSAATLTVAGWAIDRINPTSAIPVHVYVTDPAGRQTGYVLTANGLRSDVGAAYPYAGSNHGFSMSIPVTMPGAYSACAYAIGTPRPGPNNLYLGCRTANFGPGQPTGYVDQLAVVVQNGSPAISVQGWAFDNAARSAPTQVHIYVVDPAGRSTGYAVNATGLRADVGAVFPGAGSNHGFALSTPISTPGAYQVCVYSIAASIFGSPNTNLACRTVRLGPSAPGGYFDYATFNPSSGSITAAGWAMDFGLPPVNTAVHIYVTAPDGTTRGYAIDANGQRADVGRAFPGSGDSHGFSTQMPVGDPGDYRVCVYPISAPIFGAGHSALPCRTVTVPRVS